MCCLSFKAVPLDSIFNVRIPNHTYDDTNLSNEIRFTPLEIKIIKNFIGKHKHKSTKEIINRLQSLDEYKFKCMLFGYRKNEYFPMIYRNINNKNDFLIQISRFSRMIRKGLIRKLSFEPKKSQYISHLDMEDIYKVDFSINRNKSDQEIIDDYTGDYYNIINGVLRGNLFVFGNSYVPQRLESNTCDIQTLAQFSYDARKLIEIVDKGSIGDEIKLLYRGLDEQSLKNMLTQKSNKLRKGQIFLDKGFMSTTSNRTIAEEFAVKNLNEGKSPVILKLDISKHRPRGMVVFGSKFKDSESEALLSPSQRFKIDKIATEEISFASKNYDVLFVEVSLCI